MTLPVRRDTELADIIHHEVERQNTTIQLIASENFTSPAVHGRERHRAHEQVLRGLSRASATTAATSWSTRPRSSPATAPASCSAPSTPTCSRTRAPTPTWPCSWRCSSRATRSWACASTRAATSPTARRSTSAASSTTSSPTASTPSPRALDYDELRDLARARTAEAIVAGATAYPRIIDFAAFRAIADEVGALLMVDAAHIAGLDRRRRAPLPVPHADVVTFTTHKTLRGPRGGCILSPRRSTRPRSTRRCSRVSRAAR